MVCKEQSGAWPAVSNPVHHTRRRARREVWRRQGKTNGRVSKFPNMVEEIDTTREWRAASEMRMHMEDLWPFAVDLN